MALFRMNKYEGVYLIDTTETIYIMYSMTDVDIQLANQIFGVENASDIPSIVQFPLLETELS